MPIFDLGGQMPKASSKIKPKKAGRPSKLKTINLEHLKFLIEKGCTDEEICMFFKISRSTFYLYQQTVPEFSDILKGWKRFADEAVERSLYQRAMGYTHPSEEVFCAFGKVTRVKTVKHYPPDTTACIIWLKNRQPEKWREHPPDAPDNRFQDAELIFKDVPNQKDPNAEKRMEKFLNQN